jgi:hypothetical protein
MMDACARGGIDRISNRERDHGRGRLTKADRRCCAGEKLDLDLGILRGNGIVFGGTAVLTGGRIIK